VLLGADAATLAVCRGCGASERLAAMRHAMAVARAGVLSLGEWRVGELGAGVRWGLVSEGRREERS